MKNKLRTCLSILVFNLICNCYAQELDFGLQGGWGFYKMTDLKEYTRSINYNGKITSNYPSNFYFQPSIMLKDSGFSFGFIYSYSYTGSSSRDFAGRLTNTYINCHVPGIKLELEPEIEGLLRTSIYCELGRVFTNLTGLPEGRFIGRSFYFEPGVQFSHYLKKFYKIGLNIGYFKEFKREDFQLKGALGTQIKTNNDFYYTNGWEGLRFGLSFTFRLHKRQADSDLKS